jgi:hypothetical protein
MIGNNIEYDAKEERKFWAGDHSDGLRAHRADSNRTADRTADTTVPLTPPYR